MKWMELVCGLYTGLTVDIDDKTVFALIVGGKIPTPRTQCIPEVALVFKTQRAIL
jgi:hypothetical protein